MPRVTEQPPPRDGRTISALRVPVLIAVSTLSSACAHIEPFGMVQHTSDILRGPPLHDPSDEPTQEFVAGGFTAEFGEFEIDVAHGARKIDGRPLEQGSQVTTRWYPGRQQ